MTSKEQLQELIDELSTDSLVALVRCESGRPYAGRTQDAYRLAVGRLHELELVEKAFWRCTDLGREVVAELVGIPGHSQRHYGIGVMTAPNSLPHGPLRMPRVATPVPGKFKVPEGATVAEAFVQREASCTQCTKPLVKNDECIWVSEHGIFHPDCVERPGPSS